MLISEAESLKHFEKYCELKRQRDGTGNSV